MRVMLLVAGQVVGVRPHQVQHSMRYVRDDVAAVEFLKMNVYINVCRQGRRIRASYLENVGQLAHEALVRFLGRQLASAVVLVREEVVAQHRNVDQRLDDAVHEARVAQVYQAAKSCNAGLTSLHEVSV